MLSSIVSLVAGQGSEKRADEQAGVCKSGIRRS